MYFVVMGKELLFCYSLRTDSCSRIKDKMLIWLPRMDHFNLSGGQLR